MVPVCAWVNRPSFPCRCAPVNAPAWYPNNSLSKSVSGRAAQLTFTMGRLPRRLWLWMAAATSSFPVPLSPRIKTVALLLQTWEII